MGTGKRNDICGNFIQNKFENHAFLSTSSRAIIFAWAKPSLRVSKQ